MLYKTREFHHSYCQWQLNFLFVINECMKYFLNILKMAFDLPVTQIVKVKINKSPNASLSSLETYLGGPLASAVSWCIDEDYNDDHSVIFTC